MELGAIIESAVVVIGFATPKLIHTVPHPSTGEGSLDGCMVAALIRPDDSGTCSAIYALMQGNVRHNAVKQGYCAGTFGR